MDIELLYFDGCPNWEEARDRLAEALAATGNAGTPIRLRRIETPEAAERVAFPVTARLPPAPAGHPSKRSSRITTTCVPPLTSIRGRVCYCVQL